MNTCSDMRDDGNNHSETYLCAGWLSLMKRLDRHFKQSPLFRLLLFNGFYCWVHAFETHRSLTYTYLNYNADYTILPSFHYQYSVVVVRLPDMGYIYTSCRLASLSGYDSFTTSHQPRILYIIIKSTVFFKRDSGKPVKCNRHIYLHNDRACLSPSEKVDSSSTWHILGEVAKGPVCPFSSNMLIEVYFVFPVDGRLQQFVYCWVTLCLAVTIWGPVQPVDTTTVSVTSSRSHLVDHIWCFLQYKHL